MRRHLGQRSQTITPDQCSGQVDRIDRADRHGHWLARTAQHWRTQQHQVNRFEPLVDHSYPFYGLLGRQRSLDSQSIDRPRAFDSNELAGNKRR
jgi:hypothetical protein